MAVVKYESSKEMMMGCNFAYYHSTTKYVPTWLYMDPERVVDLQSVVVDGVNGETVEYTDSKALGTAKTSYTYTSDVNPSVEEEMIADVMDSATSTYHILTYSKAKIDVTKKILSCTIKVKQSGQTSLSTAATKATYLDGIAEGTNKFFLGSYTNGDTYFNKMESITTVSAAITSATAVPVLTTEY